MANGITALLPYQANGLRDQAFLQQLKAAEQDPEKRTALRKLKEMTSTFEAMVVHMMLKSMRSTVPEGSLIDGGLPEKFFRDMRDEEVAAEVAKTNMLGIGKHFFRQFAEQLVFGRALKDIAGIEQKNRKSLAKKELGKLQSTAGAAVNGADFPVKKANAPAD